MNQKHSMYLQTKLKQELKISPQLQQAIKILSMSSLEIEQEIESITENNPILETYEKPMISSNNSHLDFYDYYQNLPNKDNDLQNHLLSQLELIKLDDQNKIIGEFIIDSLNDNGYLTLSIDEIYTNLKQVLKITKENVKHTLSIIQDFEPTGIAARNLKECLLLQLNNLSTTKKENKTFKYAKLIADRYLDLVSKKDFIKLKKFLQINDQTLHETIHLLTSLNPKPGSIISNTTNEYIIPDLIVIKNNSTWQVELCNKYDYVKINTQYSTVANKNCDKNIKLFLKDQLRDAQWLLKSIKTRNETLLKVTTCIVNKQKDFLDHGCSAMKSLKLQDIASETKLHESTISRATNRKYLHTPHGVLELKFFFSSKIENLHGENHSAISIKNRIKQIISQESLHKPYSDSKITTILKESGINLSRRTVTKYRESLGLLASNLRRKIC